MTVKFITVKGADRLARSPFYVGLVQHERTMSRRETYEYCAERTGYKATAIRAVFMALAEYIKENQRRGNITYLDGVASIRNYVKGAFAGLSGPWVKGVNYLSVQAVEMDPFKSLLAAILPVNNSEGAKPVSPRSTRCSTRRRSSTTSSPARTCSRSQGPTSRRTR